jgi:hypothetical protein
LRNTKPATTPHRRQIEHRAAQLVDAVGRHHHGQAADVGDHVVGLGLVEALERQVVGEVGAVDARDLDPQAQGLGVVLVGPDLEDLLERSVGDVDDAYLFAGVGIDRHAHLHRCQARVAIQGYWRSSDRTTPGRDGRSDVRCRARSGG